MPDKYQFTRDDLVDQLKDQLAFLQLSGKAFDEGAEGEAKRLATVVRVLAHDTRSSTSLLTHLGVKDALTYVDTAIPINPRNLIATPGLVRMAFSGDASGGEAKYLAPLDDDVGGARKRPPKPFQEWWEDPVTKDSQGELFSRRDYVLTMSNKEGGAHVDHSLDARYANLTRNNGLGWVIHTGDQPERPVEHNPALPSVRQIGYEMETTLRLHPLKLGLY